jgi:NAD(P)-dependent dehydrogenase (short-subunit alcohol dehydrogenase family)
MLSDLDFSGFPSDFDAVVIGSTGGIGSALIHLLSEEKQVERIFAFSRKGEGINYGKITHGAIDLENEASIEKAANNISDNVRLVIIASGLLHGSTIQPEKSLHDLNVDLMHRSFAVNCYGPALVFKHFLPKLPRREKSVIGALSARVGSISDNRLGGWYSYRASKAALNMMIKTTAIEAARKWKETAIIGLHPGTVDTGLSEPFKSNVPAEKLFEPEQSARYLLAVVNQVTAKDSGQIFDWQGKIIPP